MRTEIQNQPVTNAHSVSTAIFFAFYTLSISHFRILYQTSSVGAIISPSRTDTKSIISPAPKLSPKTLKNTEMTTTNPNTKP